MAQATGRLAPSTKLLTCLVNFAYDEIRQTFKDTRIERRYMLNIRLRFTTICIVLGLLLPLTSLPLQASAPAPENFVHARFADNGEWIFTWKTVEGEHDITLQAFSPIIADVWIEVSQYGYYVTSDAAAGSISHFSTGDLIGFESYTLQFRLRLTSPNGPTQWATYNYSQV